MTNYSCPYFSQGLCSSCPHLEDVASGQTKKEQMAKTLLAPFSAQKIHPLVQVTSPWGSRNKAKMVVGGTVDSPQIGIRNREGELQEILECPLHHPSLNLLIKAFKKGITKYSLTPYDLMTKKGELKFLLLFCSPATEELMIRAVLRSKECLDRLKKFYEELRLEFPQLKVCTANLQPLHQAILEGEEEIVLSLENVIRADLSDVVLFLGPKSFYQVTSEIATKLYTQACHYILETGAKRVLDLFCGVGAFGQFLVKKGIKVTGVELSAEAISCANLANEKNGGLGNYVAEDATTFMKRESGAFDAIIVNPPRRGLNQTIIEKIKEANPQVVLYSSCNPETLARDLQQFAPEYQLREFTPFDMFPFTEHLEILAKIERTN